eukprot:3201366-Rhodomonas_salina.5
MPEPALKLEGGTIKPVSLIHTSVPDATLEESPLLEIEMERESEPKPFPTVKSPSHPATHSAVICARQSMIGRLVPDREVHPGSSETS